MIKAGLHALLCSAAGAALAALLSVAWQLGYNLTVHGEAACDLISVGTMALVAAVSAGLAGGVLSAVYQRRLAQWEKQLVELRKEEEDARRDEQSRLEAEAARKQRTHRKAIRRQVAAAATAERRLRRVSGDLGRLKESYRELYNHAPVMYFRLDVEGRLIGFNDTLLRTLGYRRADLAGHSYSELLEPVRGRPAELPRGSAPFQDGEVVARWRKRDGGLLDVWMRTVADRDADGGAVRYRSAALDLTEKNRLADELRARGGELEKANERLRVINAELESFTYIVSHDLKEPLRTLQTYGNLLAQEYSTQLGADGFQYINLLIRNSGRLGVLIDDLLTLSQAGRITRAVESFDLIEAVATARQDLTDLIQRKEASVLTEGSLHRVSGDRQRITQLLTNLIANGIKYNQSPSPQVVVSATTAPDDPRTVVVAVRDNGIGIDPAFHEQIFGMFRRLHHSDEYEGTGAGLAICKKIVEAHGGRIWVESAKGKGATFYCTLLDAPPASAAPPPRAGTLPRPSDDGIPQFAPLRGKPTRATADATGKRIVLVEDNDDHAHIMQSHGRDVGLTFTWFDTAEKAWEHLQQNRPDLVLLDIELPGMNGIELCRRVRSLPALRVTRVVLFVPRTNAERHAEGRAAGADDFLDKDLFRNRVIWQRRIQEILDQCRRTASS